MRTIVLLFSLSCFAGANLQAQSFTWIKDEKKEYDIPIGVGTWEEIASGEYYLEMKEYYDQYEVDVETVEHIDALSNQNDNLKNLTIDIYFGAWCGDSKEQLPHLLKIMEKSSLLQKTEVTYIGCDRDKKAGDLDISEANIEFVPTFIFLLDGKEIGRIVETPVETLESDMLNILKSVE